ncbi:MAG: Crp/Fnr family transcriptional regulator [Bacteroidota bacterium]
MTDIQLLAHALNAYSGIDEAAFALSAPSWKQREYGKGEFYNARGSVCKYLGFILEGVFRTYYPDDKTGTEKNLFFFSKNQIVVSFKSFVQSEPCSYFTQSMTAGRILYIHVDDLTNLYRSSHQWEHFGRLMAEQAFDLAMFRTESFLFMSPEERYLRLVSEHPDIFNSVPLYHISSFLGIAGPSLSRIRKRISEK